MEQEEIKRQPKEFVPPVEKPSLNGETIADICENIVLLKQQIHHAKSRDLCTLMQKDIDSLSVIQARQIDCGDVLEKLKRNALALTNLLDILNMAIDNTQTNIRDIITARDEEHRRYEMYVAKLYKAWRGSNRKKTKQDNQED